MKIKIYLIISASEKLSKILLSKEIKNFTLDNCSPKKNSTIGTIDPMLSTSRPIVKKDKKNKIKKPFFCELLSNWKKFKKVFIIINFLNLSLNFHTLAFFVS